MQINDRADDHCRRRCLRRTLWNNDIGHGHIQCPYDTTDDKKPAVGFCQTYHLLVCSHESRMSGRNALHTRAMRAANITEVITETEATWLALTTCFAPNRRDIYTPPPTPNISPIPRNNNDIGKTTDTAATGRVPRRATQKYLPHCILP